MRYIKTNKIIKVYSKCKDLDKSMIGTREGVIAYDEKFRIDLENTCYKASMYNDLQQRIDKAEECIINFLCSEEYCGLDGIAIAKNYEELLEILRGKDEN